MCAFISSTLETNPISEFKDYLLSRRARVTSRDLGEGVCLGRSLLLLLKGEEARSGDSDGTDAIALLTSRGGACGGDGDGF